MAAEIGKEHMRLHIWPPRRRPVLWILLSTLVSVLLCATSLWLVPHVQQSSSTAFVLATLSIWLCSFLVPAFAIGYAIYQSFQLHLDRPQRLNTILTSYGAATMVFASIYLSMALAADFRSAQDEFFHYRWEGIYVQQGSIKSVRPFTLTDRAFTGVTHSLWTTVRTKRPLPYLDEAGLASLWASRAQGPQEAIIHFDPRAVLPAFLDYFHLSIMTIATVGYGNISPVKWYAKLATDLEALTGLTLLVIALGMLLGGCPPLSSIPAA